jgi:cellulose synthase/poly-beta-1,6-N-acetylglucosamine synthase-like glycosyltransferase
MGLVLLFFAFIFLSFYSYTVYPGFLFLASRVLSRSRLKDDAILSSLFFPKVSLVISAFNEEAIIAQKIRNALALDYPEDRIEILVSSDGSTDRTNEVVVGINDSRVILHAFRQRAGKTACLNLVVPQARGEVVVFTDANSMFPTDLMRKLTRSFGSPDVGCVTGWTKYTSPESDSGTSGLYGRLEKSTKLWESLISSCVGADGAIFAIRKSLYRPLRDDDINDFVIPLDVIDQGKRVVLNPQAVCLENPSKATRDEFRRQVRITTRTLRALARRPRFMNPLRFGSFSVFILSHKVVRFLVPFCLIGSVVTNFLLLPVSYFFIVTMCAQMMFFIFAALSASRLHTGRLANLCKYFLATAAAQLIGWWRMLSGKTDTTWTPQR